MKNSKIVSTKITSAIFLAIVLVTGTIAAIFPFMGIAQAEPYYDGIDNKYNSYGPTQYPDNNYYNSYESRDYGMDNNNRKSYGNDNSYESQYQPSSKPDYKPQDSSYGKDNRDKSKDSSSKSISINKFKCINTNLNINGNNTGDINIGNKGQGYLGAYSSADGGYGGGYDGNNKKGKGFDCIINNNNNNINLVSSGNQTEQLTCEECFTENLNQAQLINLTIALSLSSVSNLEGLCEQFLANTTITNPDKLLGLRALFDNASITDVDAILRVLECLEELRLIIVPPNFDPIID